VVSRVSRLLPARTPRARRRLWPVYFASCLCAALALQLAPGAHADTAPRAARDVVPEQQLRVAVAETLRRNFVRSQLVVYPSPAYYNPYLRDSFWVAQALDDRDFSTHVLGVFAANERADGEPPTWFINAYRYPQYHDDESAALVLIWAWRNKSLYHVAPSRRSLQRALSYLTRRGRDGGFVSSAGTYASWWDAYRLPAPDVLSYNQGLYAVAMRCAKGLGLALPLHAIARAEQAYRAMYDARLGYLTVGRAIPANDTSALTGEFLSLWLFKRPILTDAMVLSTLAHLSPFGAGFRVVVAPGAGVGDGAGLVSTHDYGQPGDYQNGASWLLYDALSIGAAGLHGQPGALARLRARLALEFRHGVVLHEYLQTNPSLPYYETEPPFRDKFSWDTFALVVDRELRARAG